MLLLLPLLALLGSSAADFLAQDQFIAGTCSGEVYETELVAGNGCTQVPPDPTQRFASFSLACVNESAALVHFFKTTNCTGASSSFPYPSVIQFGCNTTEIAPRSVLRSCKPGAFAPLPSALDSALGPNCARARTHALPPSHPTFPSPGPPVAYFAGPSTCPPQKKADLLTSTRVGLCMDDARSKSSYRWACNATFALEEYWLGSGCAGPRAGVIPVHKRGCTPAANENLLGLVVDCTGKLMDSAQAAAPSQEPEGARQSSLRTARTGTPNSAILDAIRQVGLSA